MNNQHDTEKNNEEKRAKRPMWLRSIVLVFAFVVGATMLFYELFQLQVSEASEWESLAARQQLASIEIPAQRGNIYDANMKLLAQSATVWTVETSPEALNQSNIMDEAGEYTGEDPAMVAAREFASILELDEEVLYERLSNKESMYYKVQGKVEKNQADAIREAVDVYNLRGVYLTEDTKRYYPYEQMASTVLGFVGDDNNGLEGIESQYEDVLSGIPGSMTIVRDSWGGEIATGEESTVYPAEDGNSIVLTMDSDIQQILEKYLSDAVETNNAQKRGFAIAMDVNTGAILGLAVYPSYDPNQPYDILDIDTLEMLESMTEGSEEYIQAQGEARTLQWRNKALADTYEPGSVFKVITAAAALDSGLYTLDSPFSCGAQTQVADHWMSCAGDPPTAHGDISLSTALIESCNVSFIQMAAGMGVDIWYDYLTAFGFTEPTGIDLPGEPSLQAIENLIYEQDEMGPVELASCSFGQSHKYTAVQMITAVCAAINGGNLMQPYIVDRELDADGNVVKQYEPITKRQVISEETSALIAQTLEDLVTDSSSGSWVYKAGYSIGGKSGTSQKLDVMAELPEDAPQVYVSSFLGFAPADDPQIAVLMALDEPEDTTMGNFFGGRLVGPYVRDVLVDSLQVMGYSAVFDTDAELARTTVQLPKVTEKSVQEAQKQLNDLELDYEVIGDGDVVVGQSPAAYTEIPYAGKVVLYTDVSIPQEMVTVPTFSGRTPADAIELAKSVGLNVLTTGAPDDNEAARIGTQSLEAGTQVFKGSTVTLEVEDNTRVVE